MKSVTLSLLIALTALVGCRDLLAEANHWTLGLGVVHARPETRDGILGIPGSAAEFSAETQMLLTAVYRLTDHLGLEVLAAPPFSLSLTADGTIANYGTLITVKSLTPVALLRYEFGKIQNALVPYVGAGLSYSVFYDERPTESFFRLVGTEFDIDYRNSLSPILAAGLQYSFDARWSLNASISYLKPDPNVRLIISGSTIEQKGNLSAFAFAATAGVSF